MNRSDLLPFVDPPPELQRLAELPALIVADQSRDVRGCDIRGSDGTLLGTVSDLLADPDRLIAEFAIVAPAHPAAAEVVVPLSNLGMQEGHMVVGSGATPVVLRYRSTVRLTMWACVLAALLLLLTWALSTLVS